MQPTDARNDAEANALLARLLPQMRATLGEKLLGLYLYGSLVVGDFDPAISDIDLLAVLADDLDAREFAALDALHHTLAGEFPAWVDRIEIAYLSRAALQTFRTQSSPLGIVSPGEPFHIIAAGHEWLMNWYMVRTIGRTLYGPPPATWIGPIAQAEFVQAVCAHAQIWPARMDEYGQRRPAQAYAILTLCRALYTVHTGQQRSKKQAARWVADHYPQWAELVTQALAWRTAWQDETADPAATLPQTVAFVHFATAEVAALCAASD